MEVAKLIARVATWPWFQAAVATKLLHKKAPALIPVLDNQAIFGAYMAPDWPERLARGDNSVNDEARIRDALDWIHYDLNRAENRETWRLLQPEEPGATLIELFDMVWWQHFRKVQPILSRQKRQSRSARRHVES